MNMTLCRTCLSKNDLKQIFPDKNLASLRSKQLQLVCAIKIEVDDGLTQLICVTCLNLIEGALKLRESSLKSEEILKNSCTTIKLEPNDNDNQISNTTRLVIVQNGDKQKNKRETPNLNKELKKTKHFKRQIKSIPKQKRFDRTYRKRTVRIEDYESSNDSDFMNQFLIKDLDFIPTENKKKICIEDFESSDSFDQDFNDILKNEPKDIKKIHWDLNEKQLLLREKRKIQCKIQDAKLLSLAVIPYDTKGPITCKLCSKELRNIQNFKCHAKTHVELKNACEECGKKFVSPSHLRYHQQRMHGRKKRLACSTCSYRAVDPLQLQNHMRAEHTGERPYTCDVCGNTFRMRANIAQHMRKHFGVRNLQCDRCPSMFRSRSELTCHQNRVHFLVYTYPCYLCPETYKRLPSAKRHLANVHGVPKNQQLPIKCIKTRRGSCDEKD